MKTYEGQKFQFLGDRNSGCLFSDLEFRNCLFQGSAISFARKPRLRSTIRNVRLMDCHAVGCEVGAAIVEDVLVDRLNTEECLSTFGAVFKHVTLRDAIGPILISPLILPGVATPEEQQEFDEANAAYYQTVDWALDISEAEFVEADIRTIPSHLIRRDSATQIIIKREKALEGRWRQLDFSGTYWPHAIDYFLRHGKPDCVLVAPKRGRDFHSLLGDLNKLRQAGVAEAD